MILDLMQPILACHPAGAHALMFWIEIETVETFRRYDAQILSYFLEIVQEETCELAVTMNYDPDRFRRPRIAQHVVTGGPLHL